MRRMNPVMIACVSLGAILLFLGLLRLISSSQSGYYPRFYGMPMMGWGGGWAMSLGMLCVAFFFLVLVFFAFRYGAWGGWSRGGCCGMRDSMEAEEILRERYARGEVSREQYEEIMRDLKQR